MTDHVKEFNENGYTVLRGFLDELVCQQLNTTLHNSVNKMDEDAMCPLSKAIPSSELPALDGVLEQLVPHLEVATGRKLLPTYAYARIYKPGEVLQKHRDRPSCEISATVTVGLNGDPWPIFMSHEKDPENPTPVHLNVGDAVLYWGEKMWHWRDKYTQGEWQAQIFFHYVDANGPNAEWVYDKRPTLSHHTHLLCKDVEIGNHGNALVFHNAFSKEACDRIIQMTESEAGMTAMIGTGDGNVNTEIRNTNKLPIPHTKGIGATLTGIGINLNNLYYKFDIKGSNQSEFLRYDVGGHYKTHMDAAFNLKDPTLDLDQTRKLTVLLFLNDDYEGGRLFLQTQDEKYYPPQKAGTVVVFPSIIPHSVEPVTKGRRTSLVTWLVGPMFK